MPDSTTQYNAFLFDNEQLHATATVPVIRRGLSYFQNYRVTELICDEEYLHAFVEDMKSGETLNTIIAYKEGGNLYISCECPDESPLCQHVNDGPGFGLWAARSISVRLPHADSVPTSMIQTFAQESRGFIESTLRATH